MRSVYLVFCDCDFHSVCPLMDEDKRFVEASWWEELAGSLCWVPRLGNLLWALEFLQQCENFFGIIVLWFAGHLLKGFTVEIMATSSNSTYSTCHTSQVFCSLSPFLGTGLCSPMPLQCSNYCAIVLISHASRTKNFRMLKLDLEKAVEPEIKLPTSTGS